MPLFFIKKIQATTMKAKEKLTQTKTLKTKQEINCIWGKMFHEDLIGIKGNVVNVEVFTRFQRFEHVFT